MNQGQTQMGTDAGIAPPRAGDRFQCQSCGMEIQVTKDCNSRDNCHFHCCGREMQKA